MILSETIKSDLDTIKDMVESEMGHQVITNSEQAEVMMTKRMFVNIIHHKYDLRVNSFILNKPLLADYMKLSDPIDVNHFLNGFDMYLRYNKFVNNSWIKLKALIGDNAYDKLKYLKEQRKDLDIRSIVVWEQIKALEDEEKSED